MYRIRTYETKNNTYHLAYGRTAKTSYEEQEEQKEEFRYILIQKAIGIGLLILAMFSLIIVKTVSEFGIFTLIFIFLGLVVLFNKDHVFNN